MSSFPKHGAFSKKAGQDRGKAPQLLANPFSEAHVFHSGLPGRISSDPVRRARRTAGRIPRFSKGSPKDGRKIAARPAGSMMRVSRKKTAPRMNAASPVL